MGKLRADPGTHTAASVEGWEYPFARLEAMLADLWDITYLAAGPKKRISYPRPFGQTPHVLRRGDADGRTPEQVMALLRDGQPEPPV